MQELPGHHYMDWIGEGIRRERGREGGKKGKEGRRRDEGGFCKST